MGQNTRFEKMATKTAANNVITWTANEPTAALTQTIADGDTPTVAELGQFAANQILVNSKLIADIETLRSKMNSGE